MDSTVRSRAIARRRRPTVATARRASVDASRGMTVIVARKVSRCPFSAGCTNARCLACSPGSWGDDCANKCDCTGSPCDPQTGECTCSPGRMGAQCERGRATRSRANPSGCIRWRCRLSGEHVRSGLQAVRVSIVRAVRRGHRRVSMSVGLERRCMSVSVDG